MKKLFKGFITLLFGLMLLGLIWGFFLESKWEIGVQQSINSDPATIFPQLNSLRQWPTWTVWNSNNYPEMRMSYEGEEYGPGAIQRWDDGHTQGIIRITASEPNRSISYHLSMDEESIQMDGEFLLQYRGDATDVQWRLSGDSGKNPIARLMMLAYKPVIQADLETNLRQLRDKLSQTNPLPAPTEQTD